MVVIRSTNATDVPDILALGTAYLITSVIVIATNAIVVIVVVKSQELHHPTLMNIAFMAVCDSLYALVVLVFYAPSAFLSRFAYSDTMIGISSCLSMLLYGQNVLNVVIATVDRYISLCWPMKYVILLTSRRFICAVATTIVINVTRLCLIVIPDPVFHYNPETASSVHFYHTTFSVAASVGFTAVSMCVITILLVKIVAEIVHSRLNYNSLTNMKMVQFSITMSISVGIFCLSYLPTSIAIIWRLNYSIESVPLELKRTAAFCSLSNSLWNVFIYGVTYRPFRIAGLRLFCPRYYRRKRQLSFQAGVKRERTVCRQYSHYRNANGRHYSMSMQ